MADAATPAAPAAASTPPATSTPIPPPVTPPAAPAAPAAADTRANDPMWQNLVQGLGIAVGTPAEPAVEPAPPVQTDTVGVPFGQAAFFRDENAKLAKPGDEPPAAPATPPATPEPSPAVPPAQPAPPAPPATPPPEPIQVETRPPIEKVVEGAVKKALEKEKKNEPAPAPPAAPVDPYEANLGEIEKEELDFYRFAASKDAQHKELPGKLIGFYKKFDAWMEGKTKADPEWRYSDEDPEVRKFIKENRPALSQSARRKLEREQITESVTKDVEQRVKKDMAEQVGRVEKETHLLKVKPQIESTVSQFTSGLTEVLAKGDNPIAAEVIEKSKSDGWKKTVDEDPIFAPIVKTLTDRGVHLASEYAALSANAKSLDGNNRDHEWLINFIDLQGGAFAKNGGKSLIRDGRQFLPVAQYNQVVSEDGANAKKYWTFNDRDILERLAWNTQFCIGEEIKIQNERLVKAGFERKKPAPTENKNPATTTPTAANLSSQPPPSPKATPSAAPGAASTTSKTPATIMDEATRKRLNLPAVQ